MMATGERGAASHTTSPGVAVTAHSALPFASLPVPTFAWLPFVDNIAGVNPIVPVPRTNAAPPCGR